MAESALSPWIPTVQRFAGSGHIGQRADSWEKLRMGDKSALARHSTDQAWRDLRQWVAKHELISGSGIFLAIISAPLIALLRGATLTDLKEALGDVIAISVLAPLTLATVTY